MAEEEPEAKRSPAPPSLNDLPNTVLLRILKFLPLIYAVRTSLISRRWRNLWHSMPSLKILITKFPAYSTDSSLVRYLFTNFVVLALVHRPNTIPLRKFRLIFHYTENHRYRSLVTSWLRYALSCHVIDVELNFGVTLNVRNNDDDGDGDDNKNSNGNGDKLYDFHFFDLKNSSVRILALLSCRLVLPLSVSTRFGSLRSVTLVDVDVADEVLSDMILKCENLENLVLNQFRGLRKFKIFSEKLKELELSLYYPVEFEEFESSVEICAPNLCSIRIDDFYVEKWDVKDLSSLVAAKLNFHSREEYCLRCWINVMSILSGVKRLNVQNMWLTEMLEHFREEHVHIAEEQEEHLRRQARFVEEQEEHLRRQARIVEEQEEHLRRQARFVEEQEEHLRRQARIVEEQEEHLRRQARIVEEQEEHLRRQAGIVEEQEEHLRRQDEQLRFLQEKIALMSSHFQSMPGAQLTSSASPEDVALARDGSPIP